MPAGEWNSGPIYLKSRIRLNIAKGAEGLGGTDPNLAFHHEPRKRDGNKINDGVSIKFMTAYLMAPRKRLGEEFIIKQMFLAAASAIAFAAPVAAQQSPVPYGTPLSLEQAQASVAAAERSAIAHNFTMAFAVVEPSGELILFQKMDGTQYGSELVAREKARTAARFKRSTKAFSDSIAGGRNAILSLPGVIAVEGGVLIVINGRIVGALGISGGTSEQDGEVATAALLGVK